MEKDKYDIVFRLLDHPEDFTENQIEQLLKDEEILEIYTLICATRSASVSIPDYDIDSEWEKLHTADSRRRWRRLFSGSRVAIAAIFAATVLVAAAVGITVKYSGVASKDTAKTKFTEDTELVSENIVEVSPNVEDAASIKPIIFENETLLKILETISHNYGYSVKVENATTANLRLYYNFNPSLTINEVVDQLNSFDRIQIIISNNTLIIN